MPLLLQLALILVAVAGGVTDLRSRRIPNYLNFSGVILGIGLNLFIAQSSGLRTAILGLGLAMLIYIPLYLIRAMGAGDAKFMAAIGAIIGPENWFTLFLITAILGGFASITLVAARNRVALTMSNVTTIAGELAHGRLPYRKDPSLDVHNKQAVGMPHGTIIAISAVIFLCFWAR